MKPLAAITEWSCALACVTSFANAYGITGDQNTIISKFSSHFPEWHFRKGLLTRMEILRLLELLGFHFGYVLLTTDKDEFLAAFSKHYSAQTLVGSFAIVHNPTNHCLGIVDINGDNLGLMEPHQTTPHIFRLTWDALQERNPELLLLAR
jgi:hypothetical protein